MGKFSARVAHNLDVKQFNYQPQGKSLDGCSPKSKTFVKQTNYHQMSNACV